MNHLNIKIIGKVQGVGFRFTVKQLADKLKLSGFVKNLLDGSVHIEAEGADNKLQKFADWCKKGPAYANITNVIITSGEIKKFTKFNIVL